jgi:hypothetical protein
VGARGIEPLTPSMSRKCSTAELSARPRHTPGRAASRRGIDNRPVGRNDEFGGTFSFVVSEFDLGHEP